VQRDEALQRVGEVRAPLRQAAAEGVLLQVVRVRQVVHIRQQGAELLAVRPDAADRHAAEVDAVVAALASDQPHPLPVAAGTMVGERDLQRGIRALRARVGEEDAVEAGRQHLRQLGGGLEGDRMADLVVGRVVHQAGLPLDRLGDLAPPVPGTDAPKPRRPVDHRTPLGRVVVHALGADEHPGRRLEGAVGRERHPEGVEVVGQDHAVAHARPRRPVSHGSIGPGRGRSKRRLCHADPIPAGERR